MENEPVDSVITTARAAVLKLSEQLRSLPDEGDLPTPNARERVVQQRELLLARRNHLQSLTFAVLRLPSRLPLEEWRALLLTAIAEFEAELANLEDERLKPADVQIPDTTTLRRNERRDTAVRQSLRTLQAGPETFPSGELMPEPLVSWFEKHDVIPVMGHWFNGRGGLRRTEERIVELDEKRVEAVSTLQHYLTTYEELGNADRQGGNDVVATTGTAESLRTTVGTVPDSVGPGQS